MKATQSVGNVYAAATLCLSFVVGSGASLAQQSRVDGWQGARWGMTRSEVMQAYPAAAQTHLKTGGRTIDYLELSSFDLSGCDVRISFLFKVEGLNSVTLALNQNFSPDVELAKSKTLQCVGFLERGLISKYGKPAMVDDASSKLSTKTHVLTWIIDTTQIVFDNMVSSSPMFELNTTNITYMRKQAGLGKGL